MKPIYFLCLIGVSACGPSCGARKDSAPAATTPAPSASATTPAAAVASAAPESSSPRVAPITKLVPRNRPVPRAACPLAIEPGLAFGPIELGSTLADLGKLGLPVKSENIGTATFAEVGALKVSLCGGKVVDIWMDDLRKAPNCVTFEGKPVARNVGREDLEKRFGACTNAPPRIGGAFERCVDGGVYVGHGMGDFMQIRVQPKGYELDDLCPKLLDDGSPMALSKKARKRVLEQTADLDALSAYWHPDKPGRDPLRIVKSDLFPDLPQFNMFGSAIVWIDRAEAKSGTAFFEITKMEATKTLLVVEFRYAIEGVSGRAEFVPYADDEWRIKSREVRER